MNESTRMRILMSLEVVDWRKHIMPKATFILHTKEEDEIFKKYVGKSYKGMNRMIRKCIGRLTP